MLGSSAKIARQPFSYFIVVSSYRTPTKDTNMTSQRIILPTTCLRLNASSWLGTHHRNLLGSLSLATSEAAALVADVPRYLTNHDLRTSVLPTLAEAGVPFLLFRGRGTNPFPKIDDDGFVVLDTMDNRPRSLIAIMRSSDASEADRERVASSLAETYPGSVITAYTRLLRVDHTEIDATTVEKIVDGRNTSNPSIPIEAQDVLVAIKTLYMEEGRDPSFVVMESVLWEFWQACVESNVETFDDVWSIFNDVAYCPLTRILRRQGIDSVELDMLADLLGPERIALLRRIVEEKEDMDDRQAEFWLTHANVTAHLISGDVLDIASARRILDESD